MTEDRVEPEASSDVEEVRNPRGAGGPARDEPIRP
jgi:hypothetical protein